HIMVTGHLEYDATTLKDEYDRDVAKGVDIQLPKNYFPNDDPAKIPPNTWRPHTHLLFLNWLNYYVYQETPFHWEYIFDCYVNNKVYSQRRYKEVKGL